MERIVAHIKKKWKVYAMAIWMLGVTGYLFHLNGQIQAIQQTSMKLSSDVDSIESVIITTDASVQEIKKLSQAMSAKVANMHKRVMRR